MADFGRMPLDYGSRMYDAQLGRFMTIDPAIGNYKSLSPFVYGANNPLRFIDILGLGPGDRVKKAQSFAGTPYLQQTGTELRTGNSAAALAYLDCSELVCRVLAADGVTKEVQSMNTEGLKKFLANEDKFIRSKNEPQPGDIFLWRTGSGGHTGIVVSCDPKTGEVVTAEAKGKDYGTLDSNSRKLSSMINMQEWEVFFRLKEESEDEDSGNPDIIKQLSTWAVYVTPENFRVYMNRMKTELLTIQKRQEERQARIRRSQKIVSSFINYMRRINEVTKYDGQKWKK